MSTFTQGHALLVGVGADLANTIDDAVELNAILTDEERCAYPKEQVQLLTGEQATRADVLVGLEPDTLVPIAPAWARQADAPRP